MVERFFRLPQIEAGVGDDEEPQILLLSGPPSSGKSSLLFQFAFNAAAAHNSSSSSVVFLCNRRANPPFLSQGVDPTCQPFQRIHIKYVDDEEGIKNYLAGFHLHHAFPALVVIDDFAHFFHHRNGPRGGELAVAGALALCQNALAHAKEAGCRCSVILSDTHQGGGSSKFLYIFKRWVSSIYTIRGDGFGSFLLNETYQSGNGNANSTAKYSIALQHLVLEAITQDESSNAVYDSLIH